VPDWLNSLSFLVLDAGLGEDRIFEALEEMAQGRTQELNSISFLQKWLCSGMIRAQKLTRAPN
jgi:hypothetical protein